MLDDTPTNRTDDAGWFRHFRMTKYLPAMPQKFTTALDLCAADAAETRAAMTGYTAAAIDILLHIQIPAKDIAAHLAMDFNLTPQHLLLLELDDFARLSQRSKITLGETLSKAGFLIDNGTVAGFRLPADATRPPRPKQPPQP